MVYTTNNARECCSPVSMLSVEVKPINQVRVFETSVNIYC